VHHAAARLHIHWADDSAVDDGLLGFRVQCR
jgi:hypothetical protein